MIHEALIQSHEAWISTDAFEQPVPLKVPPSEVILAVLPMKSLSPQEVAVHAWVVERCKWGNGPCDQGGGI
jgi:hypothetical protein